ncbi:serine/threonine protein kinase [Plasmodium falciparum Palo Alto/Uganda]|nr:serine/threonine protein kinase [Plasmodium falciparum Palo Alto/Uganda]
MKHLCVENKMHIKKNVRQIIKKKKKNIYKTIKCLNSYKTLIDQVNVKGDEEHKLSNHVNNKKKKKKNCINENNDDNNNDNYNDNNDDNNNDNYNDNNNDNYNDNNNDHNDHNDHNNNDNNNDLNNDHRNDNNQREHSCEEINIQNVEQKCEGEKYEGKRKNKYTYYNNYYKINGKNEIHDDYNIKSHGSRINYNIFNIKDNKHNNNDKGEKSCELKKCSIPYVKEKYNLENNTYEIIGLIYYGDKSQVYKCINMNNKRVYAMKVVLKECNEIFVDNFIKKYLFLKNNPHKNIISIYDIFCNNNYICIIMDYCEGSTLLDYFMSLVPGSLDVYEIKKIMKNIFIALDFFHSNNIIHRDIKLENIMFKNKKRKKKRFNYEKYGSFLFNNHEEISFSTSCSNLHKKDLQLRGMDTIGKKIMGGKKFIRNLYNEKHKNLNIFQKNCSHILKKNTKKNILSNDIQLKSPKCYIKYNNNMDTLFNYEDDSNWSYNSSICYDIIQVSDEEEYDNVNIKDKLYEYNMCTDSSRYERIVNYENSIHSHNPYGTNSKYETFCDDAFPSQICSIHNYNKKGGRYNFSKLYKNKKNMKSNMNPSFSDLCIIDMDMIEIVSKTKFPGINKSKIICGTPPYMPPESFDGIVSPGNDIWACGVILYVLMDGRFPYEINNYMPIHLKKKILMENKPKFEPFIWKQHTDLLDLCLRLLDPNPWTRIQNAREALIHYSFRDLI